MEIHIKLLKEALESLRSLEWQHANEGDCMECPKCFRCKWTHHDGKPAGHEPSCELNSLIKRIDEKLSEDTCGGCGGINGDHGYFCPGQK